MITTYNFITGIKGRAGNWVIYERCGRIVIRAKPERKAPMSDECIAAQHRFGSLARFWKAVKTAHLADAWLDAPDIPVGWSGYNLFAKRNFPAFDATGLLVVPERIRLTPAGGLQLPNSIAIEKDVGEDAYAVTWKNTGDCPACRATDEVVLAVMRGGKRFDVKFLEPTGGRAERGDGKVQFVIPPNLKEYGHLYYYLQDGARCSECVYLSIPL